MAVTVCFLAACAVTKSSTKVTMMPVGGGHPGEATFKSNLISASSGDVSMVLADGSTLSGRWSELSRGQSLETFYISTPRGLVTGAALAQNSSPWGVATLTGAGTTMLCVYTGSQSSGFGRCADSEGREWIGNWSITNEARSACRRSRVLCD